MHIYIYMSVFMLYLYNSSKFSGSLAVATKMKAMKNFPTTI